MDRTRFLKVIVVVLLIINAGTLAYLFMGSKQNTQLQMHKPGEGPAEFIIKTLQFTPEQKEQFIVLRDDHRRQMRFLHDSLRTVREEYFDALKADTYDTAKTNKLNSQISYLEGRKHQITFNHFVQVRKLCTAKQQELFDEFIDDILKAMAPPPPPAKGHRPPPR